jgi:stearoyl-CoA desaturase (delta-9 desaturase)
LLERLGLAWDIQIPSNLPPRQGTTAAPEGAEYVMHRV